MQSEYQDCRVLHELAKWFYEVSLKTEVKSNLCSLLLSRDSNAKIIQYFSRIVSVILSTSITHVAGFLHSINHKQYSFNLESPLIVASSRPFETSSKFLSPHSTQSRARSTNKLAHLPSAARSSPVSGPKISQTRSSRNATAAPRRFPPILLDRKCGGGLSRVADRYRISIPGQK